MKPSLRKKSEYERRADLKRRGEPKWLSDLFKGDIGDEVWKPLPGFDGLYEISSLGRVKSIGGRPRCRFDRILRTAKSGDRYEQAILSIEGKKYRISVHRMVCWAFHGAPPSPIHHAAHGDGNSHRNHYDNLSWKTPKENQADRVIHGTHCRGARSANAKLTNDDVLEIRQRLTAGGVSPPSLIRL